MRRARTTVCLAKWLTLYISICCCFKINLVEISRHTIWVTLLRVGWVLALNWVYRVSCTISLFNLAHAETETLRSKVFLWWICLCPSKSAYVFWLTFYFFPFLFLTAIRRVQSKSSMIIIGIMFVWPGMETHEQLNTSKMATRFRQTMLVKHRIN